MMPLPSAWIEANQRYVVAALAVVQCRLEAALARLNGEAFDEERLAATLAARAAAAAISPPPALLRVRELFGLSAFQYEILTLAAAVELSSTIGRLCAQLQNDSRRAAASFGLALAVFPDAHWSALAPDAPLRRWRLIELGDGGLTDATLRIDERLLHEVVGVGGVDARLRGCVQVPGEDAPPRLASAVDEVARCLDGPSCPTVVLTGESAPARATVGCAALQRIELDALVVRPARANAVDAFVTLVQREAILRNAGLVIEHSATDSAEHVELAHALTAGVAGVVVSSDGNFVVRGASVHVALPALDAGGRRELWERSLGSAAAQLGGVLEELISEFRPSAEEIVRLGDEWRCRVEAGEAVPDGEHPLRARLRADNRAHFAGLAQVIAPVADAADLVLPAAQADTIAQIEAHVRYRQVVLDDWGFAGRDGRGLGIAALFHGPSGTGKTLAAEVIARRLGFDLIRVDLSQVVSKYIGETEKNLARIFDAADRGGCVLLFDEADALFGKRSEVRDSHDRYANIEVGYLLQRIEAFRGLAILTTNLKQVLDPAFLRRLRFVVAFPFPDVVERKRIWQRSFPQATPCDRLDFDRVARLQVTGGNIRSIALHAAFLAATEDAPVSMRHVLRASRDECVRIEKAVTAAEIGGWT
ncbi:MAG: ATP-binding protein [Myxococcales bacterium]|nr:MAG: ATP-binding protein [Myxococcales bacterium]